MNSVQVYVHMDDIHTIPHTTLILIVEKYISLKYIAYKIIIPLHICLKLKYGVLGRTKAWDNLTGIIFNYWNTYKYKGIVVIILN